MSTKNICLALLAFVLTAGLGAVAQADRTPTMKTAATAPAACSTSYGTVTGADGRAVSVTEVTCSRTAQRLANGVAL